MHLKQVPYPPPPPNRDYINIVAYVMVVFPEESVACQFVRQTQQQQNGHINLHLGQLTRAVLML